MTTTTFYGSVRTLPAAYLRKDDMIELSSFDPDIDRVGDVWVTVISVHRRRDQVMVIATGVTPDRAYTIEKCQPLHEVRTRVAVKVDPWQT